LRSKRRKASLNTLDRRWLFALTGLLAIFLITVNCSLGLNEQDLLKDVSTISGNEVIAQSQFDTGQEQAAAVPLSGPPPFIAEDLWADITESITAPKPAHTTPTNISLDVRDADLIDVLSMLAYKLDANIIYLEEPQRITIRTEQLSPLNTMQIVLQKVGFDYLTIGRNYIVGERGRLYDDFANRMLLTRYSLFYVSAEAMESYISQLGVPVQSLTVDANQKAIWMQGTPMTLGKAREIINRLDIMENAAFADGGARKIRMPVAMANGSRAEEELEALIDLLSILLDGFRDGRSDMGWVTWDHPDPVPYIFMDWENPIIKPYDIKMKITRDFANSYSDQIRYLIAEGTPDNIELVNQMIAAIAGTPSAPFSLTEEEEIPAELNETVQYIPPVPQASNLPSHSVTLNAVPAEGGAISGSGSYTQGSSVTVIAKSNEGYEFVHWVEKGVILSTGTTYTFNIYENRNIEAVFLTRHSNNNSDEAVGDIEPSG
jgi:hypothetical protein